MCGVNISVVERSGEDVLQYNLSRVINLFHHFCQERIPCIKTTINIFSR